MLVQGRAAFNASGPTSAKLRFDKWANIMTGRFGRRLSDKNRQGKKTLRWWIGRAAMLIELLRSNDCPLSYLQIENLL